MEVSIVIVSFNSGPLLIECVLSALAASPPCEVIVSDNGSTDCSVEPLTELAEHEPRLKVLRNRRNLGFAKANNAALPFATGEYLLFLNPDCLIARETIARTLKALREVPRAGMAGCLIRNPDGSIEENCRRAIPTPRRLLGRLLDTNLDRSATGDADAPVEAISGAFMLVRREIIDRVGAFDESYFLHWEDLDLCLRVRRAGHALLFVADVEVIHFKGRSSFRRPLRVEWHKHAGLVRFMQNHYFAWCPLPVFAVLALPIWIRFALRAALRRPQQIAEPVSAGTVTPDTNAGEVWVFGATSLVAGWLLPRLVAAGFRVRAFCRDPLAAGAADSPHLTWHALQLADPGHALPNAQPDTLIHLAPLYTLPDWIGTLADRGLRRVIAFSSTSRFTKLNSPSPGERQLAESLARAESELGAACDQRRIAWTILRPTLIYSLGQDRNITVLWRFIRWFGFFPMPGRGIGKRQPIHADDLARACLALMKADGAWNRAYNVSGGETLSFRALVEAIFRRMQRKPRIISIPIAWWRPLLLAARLLPPFRKVRYEMLDRVNADLCFDHDEAEKAFGFAARRFEP